MNEHQQPAGWYPDQHGIVRWWDGTQWTQHTAPQGVPQATATDTRTRQARNGLGIAALIVGIIGCLFGLVPLMFWVAGPLGVTGLILGLAGRGRVKRREATNIKTAWAGVVVSLAALALSVYGAAVTFDAFSDLGEELDSADDPAPVVQNDDEVTEAAAESGDDAAAAAGSRENPHPAGTTADLGDWQVSIDTTAPDGTAVIAEASEFNPAPQDGNEYVVAPVSATFSGDDTGTAWLDLSVEFVSAGGNTYDGFCGLLTDGLMEQGEQFPGATVDANVCAEVPADQVDGGVWRVTESLTLDQSTAFFAMQ